MDVDRLTQELILARETPGEYGTEMCIEEAQAEWTAAVRRARAKMLDRIADKWIRTQMDDPDSSLMKYHREKIEWEREYDRMMAEDIRHRNEGKVSDSWFVTLNPPKDYSPGDLWGTVTGYLKKNCPKSVKAWHAVIEQRSEDPEFPTGWHVHFIVQYHERITRSVAMQKMRSTIDRIWPKEAQKQREFTRNWCVWVHLAPHHQAYIRGDKKDEKMTKVAVDKIARERYGFPPCAFGGAEIIFPGIDIVSDGIQEVCAQAGPSGGEVPEETVCPGR